MKTRVKRLLLTTGVLGSVAVPFGAVISCGKDKANNQTVPTHVEFQDW